jgi:serine/threonine protein kinase
MFRQRPYVGIRPPTPPLPPRFTVERLLGEGAHTEVYRAHDRELDRVVAVKLFPAEPDPEACRRIADEARALDRLHHRRLVAVYDGGVHRNRPYLVMQLIRGQSLDRRLRTGPLPAGRATPLVALLADALDHVHSSGIVHRDIKPSNILLDQQGLPHLGDFGIALLAGQTRVTSVDEIVGTPAYLAPEQVYGGRLGPAVDVYALGLVLLECVTGRREYDGATKMDAALARLDRPPRIPTGLPPALAELLRAMTDLEPIHRPSARRCVDTLGAVVRDLLDEPPPTLVMAPIPVPLSQSITEPITQSDRP